MESKIVTVDSKKDEKFLRQKTREFDFKKFSRAETNDLVARMKKAMKDARGIGLSANQIGLDMRVFVVQIQKTEGAGSKSPSAGEQKFYAVFNPEIVKFSDGKVPFEEGCLSVPGVYGEVMRPDRVALVGFDKNGKKIKIKASGLLARVFQHEMDHLNGKLFIDKAAKVHKIVPAEHAED